MLRTLLSPLSPYPPESPTSDTSSSSTSPVSSPSSTPPVSPSTLPKWVCQQAKRDLEAYVHFWSSNVTLEEARRFIIEGNQIIADIFQKILCNPNHYPGGAEKALNAISWSLMAIALKKGQGHVYGSFTIEDVDGLFHKFLNRLRATYKSGSRWSTHYVGRSDPAIFKFVSLHDGVDVCTGKMPAGMYHILFGQVQTPPHMAKKVGRSLLFFKLEAYSPFWTSGFVPGSHRMLHSAETVISIWNKWVSPENDNRDEMAKEHIPGNLQNLFKELINNLDRERVPQLIKRLQAMGFVERALEDMKCFGICYIYTFLQEARALQLLLSGYDPKPLDNVLATFDHPSKCKGREVYIENSELRTHIAENLY